MRKPETLQKLSNFQRSLEMVESELSKPEVSTVHVDDAPTLENNQTNEAGIEDFASLRENFQILINWCPQLRREIVHQRRECTISYPSP